MSGDLILFPKAKEKDDAVEPPADVKEREPMGCRHRGRKTLDPDAHQITCSECGQVLDPFDWILEYVRRWDRMNVRYRQAEQQARQAEERVAKLKRVEANAKARIRGKGILLSSAEARAARDTLRALAYALRSGDDPEGAARTAKLYGYRPDDLRRAIAALDAQIELREVAES